MATPSSFRTAFGSSCSSCHNTSCCFDRERAGAVVDDELTAVEDEEAQQQTWHQLGDDHQQHQHRQQQEQELVDQLQQQQEQELLDHKQQTQHLLHQQQQQQVDQKQQTQQQQKQQERVDQMQQQQQEGVHQKQQQKTLGQIVFSPLARQAQQTSAKQSDGDGEFHFVNGLRRSVCNWKIGARFFACRSCGSRPLKRSAIVTPRSSTSSGSIRNFTSLDSFDDHEADLDISAKSELPDNEVTVEIPLGMIGLAWFDSEPLFLPSGSHFFPANSFSLQRLASVNAPIIDHGYLHRIFVPHGHLGVAWTDGQAELVQPGNSVWSCSTFAHAIADECALSKKEAVLGPFRIVKVDQNEVGVKFCNRKPVILHPGRHVVDISKGEVFAGFESVHVRKCSHSNVLVTLKDELQIEGEVFFHWHILPEDAAAARAVGVGEIDSSVSSKLQRAFALVFWDCELEHIVKRSKSLLKDGSKITLTPSESFSSEVSKKCIEALMDMFEEGWSVTFEDLHLQSLKWYECSKGQCFEEPSRESFVSHRNHRAKKKVQIQDPAVVDTEAVT